MRNNPGKRLTILSDAEKVALYGLPDFDDFQRVEFLAMTDAERTLAGGRLPLAGAGYGVVGGVGTAAAAPKPSTATRPMITE